MSRLIFPAPKGEQGVSSRPAPFTGLRGLGSDGALPTGVKEGRWGGGMPRALLKLAKRSLPMIRLRDFELLVNNLIFLFV